MITKEEYIGAVKIVETYEKHMSELIPCFILSRKSGKNHETLVVTDESVANRLYETQKYEIMINSQLMQ